MKVARSKGLLGLIVLTAGTLLVTGWLAVRVIIPSYANPANRTYTSRLGYPALLRARQEPFPVTTVLVEQRSLTAHFLGEGLMCSEPVQVPIVPLARITRVCVREGDLVKRGQLLADLDTRLLDLRIASAKTAIETAKTTLERTKLGSLNVMPMERPELDKVRLDAAKQQVDITGKLIDLYERLAQQGAMPLEPVLRSKLTWAQAQGEVRAAEVGLKMSQPARPLSIRAAELAVEEAKLQLERLLEERKDYKIYANADGVVQQVLIHDGEYKQGVGTPAFTLAVGKWFGAYLDQTAMGHFGEGTPVNVRLEAFPGRVFAGRVEKIIPIVTYSPGGPEASRPIRPLGTGSPEWPATFTARVMLNEDQSYIVPGLTGFAEVRVDRSGVAVPRGSLASVSGGKAIAYVVDGDRFRPQEVVTGLESEGWIEILSGLKPGIEIVDEGHEVLEPGDRIAVSRPAQAKDEPRQALASQPQAQPPVERAGAAVVGATSAAAALHHAEAGTKVPEVMPTHFNSEVVH